MYQVLYDLVLYDILGYNNIDNLPYHELSFLVSTILMIISTLLFFKLAIWLVRFPFRSLL